MSKRKKLKNLLKRQNYLMDCIIQVKTMKPFLSRIGQLRRDQHYSEGNFLRRINKQSKDKVDDSARPISLSSTPYGR